MGILFYSVISSASVKATDKISENIGATYRVQEVVEKSDLGYGLTYSRSIAFTSAKSGHYIGKDGGMVGKPIIAGQEYQQALRRRKRSYKTYRCNNESSCRLPR